MLNFLHNNYYNTLIISITEPGVYYMFTVLDVLRLFTYLLCKEVLLNNVMRLHGYTAGILYILLRLRKPEQLMLMKTSVTLQEFQRF